MMKIFLGIFISLVSVCSICNGQGRSVRIAESIFNTLARYFVKDLKNAVDVVDALAGLLRNDEETTKDLTAADELFRGLTFDLLDEKISCRVARGILLKDFPTVIENFAERFGIPADVKHSLLDAQYSDNMAEWVRNFKFEKGKTGSYVYGRIASTKDGDKIDLAYTVFTLDFKISGKVIEHRHKEKLLWFTIGESVWYDTEERNLGSEEKDKLQDYFMMKAITEFRSQYPGLTKASQYCNEDSDCN